MFLNENKDLVVLHYTMELIFNLLLMGDDNENFILFMQNNGVSLFAQLTLELINK